MTPVRLSAAAGFAFAILLGTVPAAARSGPPHATDLSGLWTVPDTGPRAPFKSSGFPQSPPFTEAGRAKSKYWTDNPSAYPGSRCLPGRGPFTVIMVGDLYPLEIIQKPKQVTVISEYLSLVRRVYLDQASHADDGEHSWLGDSIGHWRGDTLLIDTVAPHEGIINGAGSGPTPLPTDKDVRLPFSENAHIKEEVRLLRNGKYLEDKVTVIDPKYYTAPLTLVSYWMRAPADWRVKEYFCSENPRKEGAPPAPAKPGGQTQ